MTTTLSDPGSVLLDISKIQITGTDAADFAETNNCGSSIKVLADCTISVTFTPKAIGKRSASLVITDSSPTSPHTIPLTGDGT